jgi:hypothetical protein
MATHNPSIEGTSTIRLRLLAAARHVNRWAARLLSRDSCTMNLTKAAFALCLPFSLFATTTHANEVAERTVIRDEAERAYRAGDFASVERQHAAYSSFLTQRTTSGAFKMTLFFDEIANAKRDATETQLQSDVARTLSWAKEHRDSPIAHVFR